MYLSDNEKRDIQKYIEAGKPLPDKYRFLLFEEKQEVELVWNGKTNEVTNTVLPFQVIEQVDEPRSEKTREVQGLLFGEGGRQISGWTNKLIWGDNKLILSSLKNGSRISSSFTRSRLRSFPHNRKGAGSGNGVGSLFCVYTEGVFDDNLPPLGNRQTGSTRSLINAPLFGRGFCFALRVPSRNFAQPRSGSPPLTRSARQNTLFCLFTLGASFYSPRVKFPR